MANTSKKTTSQGTRKLSSTQKTGMSAKEVKLQQEIIDLRKQIEGFLSEKEQAEVNQEKQAETPTPENVDKAELESVKAQLKVLSEQLMLQQTKIDPSKIRFKPVPPDDWQENGITFSVRKVFYIIGSYVDRKGVEVIPPYKLITFSYAASDVRKSGREDQIVNYATFTTNLKAEINFLRNHPLYNIEFFENLNKTISQDSIFAEFRIAAAQKVQSYTDDTVIREAQQAGIPDAVSKPTIHLRALLTEKLADQYVKEAKALEDDLIKRRFLMSASEE